jgi:hypothetical protein
MAQVTCAVFDLGAASAQTVVDSWFFRWKGSIPPHMSDASQSEKATVLRGTGGTVPGMAVAAGAPLAGSITANYPSPQIATLVKKSTAVSGRKHRGRFYIPYMAAESDINFAGDLAPASVATWQAAFSALLANLIADGIPMVIANKTLAIDPITGKKYVTHIGRGPDVTSLTVEHIVATQRRRLVRQ